MENNKTFTITFTKQNGEIVKDKKQNGMTSVESLLHKQDITV